MSARNGAWEVVLRPKAPPVAVLRTGTVVRRLRRSTDRQVNLFEDKIHVEDSRGESEALPRRYALTRSDPAAARYLWIREEPDRPEPGWPQTNATPDEVRAELTGGAAPRLRVRFPVGEEGLSARSTDPARWPRLFERELAFALAVIRYGDRFFFERHPELDEAEVWVEFCSSPSGLLSGAEYGRISSYRVTRMPGESRRLLVGAGIAAVAAIAAGAVALGRMRRS